MKIQEVEHSADNGKFMGSNSQVMHDKICLDRPLRQCMSLPIHFA